MKRRPFVKLSIGLAVAALTFATPNLAHAQAEFKLRFTDLGPNGNTPRPTVQKWWAEELKARTDGRVEVEFFWSQSLVKGRDALKAVGSGVVETGLILGLYTPGELPVWNVANLPYVFKDSWVGIQSMKELWESRPEFAEEAERNGVKIISNFATGPTHLLLAKKPVNSTEDLQGLKLRTSGGWSAVLQKLGATTVSIGFPEVYQALDLGTIDGAQTYIPAVKSHKQYEVADYITLADMGQVLGFGVAINLDVWNRMPEDLQKIVQDVSNEMADKFAQSLIEQEQELLTALTEGIDGNSVAVNELPAEVAQEWEEAASFQLDDWKAKMAERGIDGEAVLADLMAVRAKYRAELAEKGYPWTR